MRSDLFGRLLKVGIGSIATGEGKTQPAIEDELGQQIGVTGASIQRYKAGHLPPELRTIEILAEAAVKRGLLGREWLERFLHAAQYPAPERLLDKLCPTGPVRQRPPRIYENLPAPTYSQFVMRQQAFAEVAEGLTKRSAAVLIVGFGGNGKTSLAREVAARCLKGEDGVSQFDAAVWVSDKDRPGTTNLSIVLDEIARTLDYPGFTQFEHEEKRREVEQLLRRQRVLVIVDNFETITDGALLAWMLNLPEPSKALITTREYRREFRRGGWPVDLRGMTEQEARELIAERVKVLKIEKLVGDLSQLEPLWVATGGNPKAIEMTMGLLKYERRPIQDVVDDLYAARGELFDDLFARAWALLDEAARRVLLAAIFFPASARAEALSATGDVRGFMFDRAVERLTDLALIDIHQENLVAVPRYTLHPLVRAFVVARLGQMFDFAELARNRWLEWCQCLACKVGYCWDDLTRLNLLDPEQDTIFSAVSLAFEYGHYDCALDIARNSSYYCYVRGDWDRKYAIDAIRAKAANKVGKKSDELEALSFQVQLLSRQGKTRDVEKLLPYLHEIAQSGEVSFEAISAFHTAIALYWMALGDFDTAMNWWRKDLDFADKASLQTMFISRRWIAFCLHEQGRLLEAQQAFRDTLQMAVQHNHQRTATIIAPIWLARIDLDLNNFEGAEKGLSSVQRVTETYGDRVHGAFVKRLYARLHVHRGDLPAARASLAEAIDLFERLGMRRELAEAREELARLEAMSVV